jgi:hypothetical protein
MLKIGVITMALMSFLHAGWFGDLFDRTPTPPIAIPINLSKSGSTAEIVIRSDDSDKIRVFSLYFVIGKKGKDSYSRNHWIYEFVGRPGSGTVTPVKLTIYRIEKDKEPTLFYEGRIEVEDSSGSGLGINKREDIAYMKRRIDSMYLSEGKYRIRLENLQDFPELKETEIYFAIHGGRGKY